MYIYILYRLLVCTYMHTSTSVRSMSHAFIPYINNKTKILQCLVRIMPPGYFVLGTLPYMTQAGCKCIAAHDYAYSTKELLM